MVSVKYGTNTASLCLADTVRLYCSLSHDKHIGNSVHPDLPDFIARFIVPLVGLCTNALFPQSRRGLGKPKGGQAGHEKSALEAPDGSEVADIIGHPLLDDECCPKCGVVDYTPTGESEAK